MIKIGSTELKKQRNFWNGCVFHPTDAVEDPWGKRILDRMAEDKAIRTVRIYSMFEDIVYLDEDGNLCYDFRLSDLRLDYLVEKGYDLLIAYAGIPDCIAESNSSKTTSAKKATRYKGKMWNTSKPRDYALWEEICYEYTKHNVERYGIETVKKWSCDCFNEPDWPPYFLFDLPDDEASKKIRLTEYCKLYKGFANGVCRASREVRIGGPSIACYHDFLGGFLDYVKEKGLKLDFVTGHYYGTSPMGINDGTQRICVESLVEKQRKYENTLAEHGISDIPLTIDEWGMASCGFFNREECADLMKRETEVFSAYYAKLIARYLEEGFRLENLMICLSGQHEMEEDFTGFRNFFTLNFIKKPIYNAYVLAAKLGESLLKAECDNANVYTIPTKTADGSLAVMVSYSSEYFEENLPVLTENVCFDEDISEKKVTVFCIDKAHTNPYRLYQQMGKTDLSEADLKLLREEGILKPFKTQRGSEPLVLTLTPNCTYFITVE